MSRYLACLVLTVLLGFAGWSCTSSDADLSDDQARANNAPAVEPMGKHWIQDERLRSVMQGVSQQMTTHYPGGLPDDPEEPLPPDLEKSFKDAASLADALARAADQIPLAIRGNTKISAEDRAGFLEEARLLKTNAQELGSAAREQRLEGMQRTLARIDGTCMACHSKYKDISGELNRPAFSLR